MNRDEMGGNIKELKKKMNAVILAHYYEEPEVQDLGDFVGDSLGLCIEASKTNADVIVFCGVHFMAESAKLLNPDKLVLIPDSTAGCPMADMAGADELRKMKQEHPGAVVVTYVNSTAAVKAESDICCTSSNAVKIVESVPTDKEIIFVPDQNLGKYVQQQTGRDLVLWEGYCPVHHLFVTPEDIRQRKEEYPDAEVLVHPECPPEITAEADFVGSTAQILKYCRERGVGAYIIGTETGILYPLRRENPDALFIPASDKMVCRNMKKITVEKVFHALENKGEEVTVPADIKEHALVPIQKMIERSS
jgi:quinolinate synthase